jgi:ABC-type uncharacterized transport system ATPase subunit
MREVSLRNITKSFLQVRAVDQVSITFHAGEIHAVLGENGAGKSTLMHILSGLYRPDAGEIIIDDQLQLFTSPRTARAAGIAMVHQHFMLVPTLTVAENILLALPGKGYTPVRRQSLGQQVLDLASQYHIAIAPPDTKIANLSVGAQQRIEILKALVGDAHCLILDEPTAVLTPAEVDNLFLTLARLKSEGYLIILITHKIPEVLAISDRLSILRQGRLITSRPTASCSKEELARLMIGDEYGSPVSLPPPKPREDKQSSLPLLALENIWSCSPSGQIALRGISFLLHTGEVIGIAGVDGNGQTDLTELLIGLQFPVQGTIQLSGQPLTAFTPSQLRSARVSLIPQDRRREGLALPLSIAENLLLNVHTLTLLTPNFLLFPHVVHRFARQQIARFGIQPSSPTQPASTLSGGNQQRVVIARELAHDPLVIVAATPSRGLDIGATQYVHEALLSCCRRGTGMVLISTDLDEILTLSDTVYTLYRGQLLGPVEPTVGREQIGRMMTGA